MPEKISQIRGSLLFREGFTPMILVDLEGNVIDLNKEACKEYKWDKKRIVGSSFARLIPVIHHKKATRLRNDFLKKIQIRNAENYRVDRNGKIMAVLTSLYPVEDNRGNPSGILYVDKIIPDTDVIERFLSEDQRQLKMIIDHSHDGIHQFDLKTGRYVFMSPAQERITGFKREELMFSLEESMKRLHPRDLKTVEEYINNVIEGKDDGKPMIYRWKVRSGEYRWFSDIRKVIKDEKGEAASLVGVSRDITDQVEYENKLKESNRNKNKFMAMMAHELRNPLASIFTAYDLMRQTADEDHKKEYDQIIRRQLSQLKYLIEDLIQVSRITSGKIRLRKKTLVIGNKLKDVIRSFEKQIKDKDLTVTLSIPERSIYVKGDPVRLYQIFSNVLENAIKFTPEGEKIRISGMEKEDFFLIIFQDNGKGIPKKQIKHIFNLFTQIESSDVLNDGSLGIGLALTKYLIELHGGYITADSEGRGKGSIFTIGLPITTKLPGSKRVSRIKKNTETGRKHRNILIAEDNLDLANMMKTILIKVGHRVQIVNDGLSVINQIKKQVPDIILVDLGLPGKDGFQVASVIRKMSHLNKTRIICLSGYEPDPDKVKIFDKYFVKPIPREKLLEIVG